MRILHVITTLDPAAGGPPFVVSRLAAAQASLGHDVHIASYQKPEAIPRIAKLWQPVPNHSLVQQHIFPNGKNSERIFPRAASTALSELIPPMSIVHLHGLWDPVLKTAATLSHRQNIPYTLTPHGMLDPWSMQQRRLKKQIALLLGYRKMLDRAAFLHVLNDDEKNLLAIPGLHSRRIVIPNGIFLEEIDPIPPANAFHNSHPALDNRPYILFLSRIHYKKGLDYLADAFAICAAKNPHLQLVVAGPDDGEQSNFQSRIAQLNLTNRTHLVGALYGREKVEAFAGASVFCLPSRQEGFSMAICEALACARPVVISKECHFPEVAEVNAGRIVNLNPQEIAQAILEIVDNPQGASDMGKSGRSLVESRFTWPAIAKLSISSYETAIAESKTR